MRNSFIRRCLGVLVASVCLFTTITCIPAVGQITRFFDPGYYVIEEHVFVEDPYYYYEPVYDSYEFDFWYDDCC